MKNKKTIGKRNRLRAVLCCLLSALLLVSMTGCSSNSGKTESTPTPTTAGSAPSAAPTEAAATPTPLPSLDSVESVLPGRVTVSGTDFQVNGQRLFINGVNTPWDNWNDFGGEFDVSFWDAHYAELHESGVNASRIWISCNGDIGINIDESGIVTGATAKHWQSLDTLFALAEKHGIYVMATLMSFDNFKDSNKKYTRWRAMVQSEAAIQSYVDNYVVPFCERYKDCNSLWSIDLCNEPDWIFENAECGKLPWEALGNYFAHAAAAIHQHSDVLVTIGFAVIKYNSDSYNGNYGSDEFLQSCYADKDAYLDFYSTHFYEWEAPWFGFPFDKSPEAFRLIADRPCVIGEFPATGMLGDQSNSTAMSGSEIYLNSYQNGWNGVMAWTSNGVDACGSLDDIRDGVKTVAEEHKAEVFPE